MPAKQSRGWPCRLKSRLGAKLLGLERSLKVLLPACDVHTLIGQRSAHGLLGVHALSLELHRLVVDPSLLLVRQVRQCGLHPGLRTKLLLLKRSLKVLLASGHTRCAVALELLLRTLEGALHATRLNIPKLLPEVTLTLHSSKQLAAATIGALPCGTEVLGYLRTPCAGNCLTHLRLKRSANERRHILLGFGHTELLRCGHAELLKRPLSVRSACRLHHGGRDFSCTDFSGCTHLEHLKVGRKAGLGSTHLGRTKLTSPYKLWARHPKVAELRHADLLRTEPTRVVLPGTKCP